MESELHHDVKMRIAAGFYSMNSEFYCYICFAAIVEQRLMCTFVRCHSIVIIIIIIMKTALFRH